MLGTAVVLAANTASADNVGVVATGDGALAAITSWLGQHGRAVEPTALTPEATNALVDCIVLEDVGCARGVVETASHADTIIYARVESGNVGAVHTTTITTWWIREGHDVVTQHTDCHGAHASVHACTGDALDPLLLATADPPATPPPATPPPATATAPAVMPPTSTRATIVGEPRRWHVGLWLGAEVPRGALDPGPLVGAHATLAIDPAGAWLVGVAADWVALGRDAGAVLLSPALFPRSAGELVQHEDLVTIAGGGDVRLARLGAASLYAGVTAGVQWSRTRLEAYGMSKVQSGVGPVATLEVSVVGSLGSITWRGILGWRESSRDLGAADAFAETSTSGAIVGVGADW